MNNNFLLPLLFFGSILMTLFGVYIALFVIIYKNKVRSTVKEREQLKYQYETILLNSKLEVQEEAFNKISLELHDNIGQVLGVLQYNLYSVTETLPGNRPILENSKKLVEKVITDLRNLSHQFNREHISAVGIEAAIRNEFTFLNSFHKIEARLLFSGNGPDLSDENELLTFRIVQEAISNIIKHANATSIQVTIVSEDDSFVLSIADNGKGFDPNAVRNRGIGFSNMRQRATLMNGTIDISAQVEKGTTIVLSIKR